MQSDLRKQPFLFEKEVWECPYCGAQDSDEEKIRAHIREDEKNPAFDRACEGYGSSPAKFMFVGISAGRLGARITKVPFTKDASGRIFQRCLGRLGLSKT